MREGGSSGQSGMGEGVVGREGWGTDYWAGRDGAESSGQGGRKGIREW